MSNSTNPSTINKDTKLVLDSSNINTFIPGNHLVGTVSGDRYGIATSPIRSSIIDKSLVSPTNAYYIPRESLYSSLINPVVVDQHAKILTLQAEKDRLAAEQALLRNSTVGVHEENAQLRTIVKDQDSRVNQAQLAALQLSQQVEKHEQDKRYVSDINNSLSSRISSLEQENLRLRTYISEHENVKFHLSGVQSDNVKLSESLRITREDGDRRVNAVLLENENLKKRIAELSVYISESDSLKGKITLITQENERVARLYQERISEIDLLRKRLVESEGRAVDYDNLVLRLKVSIEESERLKGTLGGSATEIHNLRLRIDELSRSQVEFENARKTIQVLSADNENLRLRIQEISVNIADGDTLRNKIVLITQENERVARLYQERITEIDGLRKSIIDLQGRLGDYDNLTLRIKVQGDELEKLKIALSNSINENNSLRVRISEFDRFSVELENSKRTIALLSSDNDALRKRIEEISIHVSDSDALRNRITLITQENERVARLYQERITEIDSLRKSIVELQGRLVDFDSLSLRLRASIEEGDKLKASLSASYNEINSLRVNIGEGESLRQRIVLLTSENERVARLYQERLAEIDGLRKSLVEFQSRNVDIENLNLRIRGYSEEIERLKASLSATLNENNNLRVTVSESETLRNRIVLITQENERVARLYQDRLSEIDGLRKSLVEFQSRNVDIENYNLRIRGYSEEIDRLKASLSATLNENNNLRLTVSESETLRNRFVLITQENERVARLYQERLSEIDSLRKQIGEWNMSYSEFESYKIKTAKLIEENSQLRALLAKQAGYHVVDTKEAQNFYTPVTTYTGKI